MQQMETITENYNQSNCRVVESLPNRYIYNTTAASKDLDIIMQEAWLHLATHSTTQKKRGIRDENCLATKKQKLKTCKFGLYSQYKTMQTKEKKAKKRKIWKRTKYKLTGAWFVLKGT